MREKLRAVRRRCSSSFVPSHSHTRYRSRSLSRTDAHTSTATAVAAATATAAAATTDAMAAATIGPPLRAARSALLRSVGRLCYARATPEASRTTNFWRQSLDSTRYDLGLR